jgi:hypothetical protein
MARGGARNGAGRKPVHDEINARELCKSAIINKFGSLEEGLKALLESGEPTLQKFVYEHAIGKPQDKLLLTTPPNTPLFTIDPLSNIEDAGNNSTKEDSSTA